MMIIKKYPKFCTTFTKKVKFIKFSKNRVIQKRNFEYDQHFYWLVTD